MGCVKSKEAQTTNSKKPPVPLVETKDGPAVVEDKPQTIAQSSAPVAPAIDSDPESIADSPKKNDENVSPSKHSDSFE